MAWLFAELSNCICTMYDGCANKKKVNIFKIKEGMPKKIALFHVFLFFIIFI